MKKLPKTKRLIAAVTATALMTTTLPEVAPETTPQAQAQVRLPQIDFQQIAGALTALTALASIIGIITTYANSGSSGLIPTDKTPRAFTEAEMRKTGELTLKKINEYRASKGLAELTWSEQHYAQSNEVLDLNVAQGDIFHPGIHNVFENLAAVPHRMGASPESIAEETVRGWKKSPGHNANLLQESITVGAVAVRQTTRQGTPSFFFAFQAN